MTKDRDIQNQVYQCFLVEASSLLPKIEQDLLSFLENPTTDKVHSLMRNAHTFKGSAASAEQETISTVAHHLEDVFKALYSPDLIWDEELSALLWECYECLRESVTAELNKSSKRSLEKIYSSFDENAILNRVAMVFAQLQTKLGDFFEREAPLPTSEELGFDVIGSIFAESMQQELQQLEAIIATGDSEQIALTLNSEAEFFMGIAESYQLPGLKELAQTVLNALEQHPHRTIHIAQLALKDFKQARINILAGERSSGGEPSIALRKLVQQEQSSSSPKLDELVQIIESKVLRLDSTEWASQVAKSAFDDPSSAWTSSKLLSSTEVYEDTAKNETEFSQELLQVEQNQEQSDTVILPSRQQDGDNAFSSQSFRGDESEGILQTLGSEQNKFEVPHDSEFFQQKQNTSSPKSAFSSTLSRKDVRVDLAQLENLNYIFGELLINQNQQTLQTQKSHANTQKTLKQLQRCQESLREMRDWSDKYFSALKTSPQSLASSSASFFSLTNSVAREKFDALEMDAYGDIYVLIQSVMETVAQLHEQIEEVDSAVKQSELMLKKQQKLITDAQENLIQARMLPLGSLLNRFPPIVKQLVTANTSPHLSVNPKSVQLELSGTHILIEKSISEKLFDPLLHLLRNAIAHGIESPEIRGKQGKSETGKIKIHAYHQGNRTIIEVADDGQGLNWEQIRQQGIVQQLLSTNQAAMASESELAELLFEPGFSTTQKINNLSGRGIGLNAVRSTIEELQGSVTVRSVAGEGTVFSLHLPLILMTAEMLICQSNGLAYALRAELIERVLQPDPSKISSQTIIQGHRPQKFLLWGEGKEAQKLPIRTLDSLLAYSFSINKVPTPIASLPQKVAPLLMIRHHNQLLCLEVEQILTKQELAIKSLHKKPTLPSYIQGYSILSDSRLVMAVDPLELIDQKWYEFEEVVPSSNFYEQTTLDSSLQGRILSSSMVIPSPPLSLSAEIEKPLLPTRVKSSDRLLNSSINLSSTLTLQGKSILILEDSLTQRKLLTLMLEKAGCSAFLAGDGQEALNQLRKHPEIEIVICDIEMPTMNGFEFLYAYHQDSTFSPVDVVMLTSRSGNKHRKMSFELGAKAYLTKPYSEQELLSLLSGLIAQKTVV